MTEALSAAVLNRHYLHGAEPSALLAWWSSLDSKRGVRARLRRAQTPEDVVLLEGFFDFLSYMPADWATRQHVYPSALVAAILAQVANHQPTDRFAAQLAKGKDNQPVMSVLRFKQLIQSRTPEEFFRRLVWAINLLDCTVNILSLTEGILQWYDEYRCGPDRNPVNRLSVKWAMDYYRQ